MLITKRLSELMGECVYRLSKQEQQILDAELFINVCKELKAIIKMQNLDYYRILRMNKEKEQLMLDANFIRYLINDILSTEKYTLSGIAYYTETPEEVIFELAAGCNTNPTFLLSQKIIGLHRTVRPELYNSILNKIRMRNFEAA